MGHPVIHYLNYWWPNLNNCFTDFLMLNPTKIHFHSVQTPYMAIPPFYLFFLNHPILTTLFYCTALMKYEINIKKNKHSRWKIYWVKKSITATKSTHQQWIPSADNLPVPTPPPHTHTPHTHTNTHTHTHIQFWPLPPPFLWLFKIVSTKNIVGVHTMI